MRSILITFIALLSASLLLGQSSKTLITNIEKNGGNKSKILAAMSAELLAITQEDFPNWNITSVDIDPKTGEIIVSGTDHKGKSFTYKGSQFGSKMSSNSTQYQPKSANSSTSYGRLECLRRWLAGLSCDPWIDASDLSIPMSKLDPVEQECRRHILIMWHG